MTVTIKTSLALCGLALAMLAGAASASAAAPEYDLAYFELSVEGKQITTEKNTHEPLGPCDVRDFSTGREVVKFSSKPMKVTVMSGPGLKTPSVVYGKGKLGLPTTAKVNRTFNPAITGPAGDCGDNGGGSEALPPDCGKRTVKRWTMQLGWPRKEQLGLSADWLDDRLYERCPGGVFPELVTETTLKGPITSKLPEKELFDPKIGKLIVIGRGERNFILHDYDQVTNLRWEVTLKRIKKA